MTILALVVGAAILLTLVLVHSYSGETAPSRRRMRRADSDDGGGSGWMYTPGDSGAGDCSADDGGGCGDGGGGDGGGGD